MTAAGERTRPVGGSNPAAAEDRLGPPAAWGRLAVALIAAAVYANAIPNEFVWDDVGQVRDNEFIRDPANLAKVFSQSYWATASAQERAEDVHYRPLTTASYILSASLTGGSPAAFRAVNVAVHALDAALVATLAMELGIGVAWALFAGLIFAIHPALTEAVAWVVGRAELLAAACSLGALLAWTRGRRMGRPGLVVASAALLLCGLLFKESAAGAVGIAIAVELIRADGGFPRRAGRTLLAAAPLFAAVAAYFALRYAALGATHYEDRVYFAGAAGWQVLLTMGKVVLYYLWLLLAPFRLRAHYDTLDFVIPATASDPIALAALALDALLLVAIAIGLARRSLAAAAVAWILAALGPYLHVVPFQWLLGERFLYLAAGGYALLLAHLGERASRHLAAGRASRWAPAVAAAIAAAVLAPRTVLRNRDWADEVTFFGKMAEQTPDLAAAHLCLGKALIERGRVAEGMRSLREAERLGMTLR
jgi:hypothetical protein